MGDKISFPIWQTDQSFLIYCANHTAFHRLYAAVKRCKKTITLKLSRVRQILIILLFFKKKKKNTFWAWLPASHVFTSVTRDAAVWQMTRCPMTAGKRRVLWLQQVFRGAREADIPLWKVWGDAQDLWRGDSQRGSRLLRTERLRMWAEQGSERSVEVAFCGGGKIKRQPAWIMDPTELLTRAAWSDLLSPSTSSSVSRPQIGLPKRLVPPPWWGSVYSRNPSAVRCDFYGLAYWTVERYVVTVGGERLNWWLIGSRWIPRSHWTPLWDLDGRLPLNCI